MMKLTPTQNATLNGLADVIQGTRSEVMRLCLESLTPNMLKAMKIAALKREAEKLEKEHEDESIRLFASTVMVKGEMEKSEAKPKRSQKREKASVSSTGLRSSEGTGAIPDPPNTRK